MNKIKSILCIIVIILLIVTDYNVIKAETLEYEYNGTMEIFDNETGILNISSLEKVTVRYSIDVNKGPFDNFFTMYPWRENEVRKVKINEGIKCINSNAFYWHKNLKEVVFPESLSYIFGLSFAHTALEEVALPKELRLIGGETFSYTPLKRIEIPNGCVLEKDVFKGCESLSEVILPKGLNNMHRNAFRDSLIWNTEDNWEDGILYVSNTAVDYKYHEVVDKEIIIRSDTDTIMNGFLAATKVRSVLFPEGLEMISEDACCGCKRLVGVYIPDSVTEIEEGAFRECELLTIYCNEGSIAQEYAIKNNIPYDTENEYLSNAPTIEEVYEIIYPKETETPTETPIPTETPTPSITPVETDIAVQTNTPSNFPTEIPLKGDGNYDKQVNASDALLILKYAAKIAPLSDEQIKILDLNEDQKIDALDALGVLKIAAKLD